MFYALHVHLDSFNTMARLNDEGSRNSSKKTMDHYLHKGDLSIKFQVEQTSRIFCQYNLFNKT